MEIRRRLLVFTRYMARYVYAIRYLSPFYVDATLDAADATEMAVIFTFVTAFICYMNGDGERRFYAPLALMLTPYYARIV